MTSPRDGVSDCDEINTHGTNPFLADTDGDGMSDYAEIVVYDPRNSTTRFNPLVADLAKISIALSSVPLIELDYVQSDGSSRTVSTDHSVSDTSSISRNWGGESSRQIEIGHTVSVEKTDTVGVEVSVSPTELGGSASYESSLSVGLSKSKTQTTGSSVNWNRTQQAENTETYNESEALSQTSGTSYEGGKLSVTARVVNDGDIAYDLKNLTLSAFIYDPKRPFDLTPVGNLEFTTRFFPTTSIQTNSESSPLNFSTDLTLPRARELLRDSRNLVIEPATYQLTNQMDQSILLSDQDVSARTATISIDYGRQDGRQQTFKVAINNGNADRSISALDALQEVLGFNVVQGPGQWVFGNEGSAKATQSGLVSIDSFAMSTSTNRYWLGAWNHRSGGNSGAQVTEVLNLLNESYDLSQIRLRSGDTLSFVYIGDADRDGLADRFEEEFGTVKDNPDSDGDSLLDATEIYGWLTNLDSPPCTEGSQVRVYSNPLKSDTDADGIDDATEKDQCGNPNFSVIADAGTDQIVNVASTVTLQGSAEGLFTEQPTYVWKLVNGPDVMVNGAPVRTLDGRNPSFNAPDEVSTLVFDLMVTVEGGTSTDRVNVQVQQDRTQAVYVGVNSSGVGDGTQSKPYPTLVEALNAIQPNQDLYVMTKVVDGNVVPYELVNSLSIPAGTDMFGGYDENWVRQVDTLQTPVELKAGSDMQGVFSYSSVTNTMHLSGFALTSTPTTSQAKDSLVALKVQGNDSGRLVVSNNSFMTGDMPNTTSISPGSNYGVYIANIAQLQLRNNAIKSGRASSGSVGRNGSQP